MMNYTHKETLTPLNKKRTLSLPVWNTFDVATVIAELNPLLAEGRDLADEIAAMSMPTFHDVVTRFENLNELISMIVGPAGHLNSVMQTAYLGLKEVNTEMRQLLSDYGTDISLHAGLYNAVVRFQCGVEFSALGKKEQYLIKKTIEDFELAGVNLSLEKKVELKKLNEESTLLGEKFSNNVLGSTDAWEKVVTEADLVGVPEDDKKRMRKSAEAKGVEGFRITLQMPVYMAIMTHADNRELRKEVSRAYATRASLLGDGSDKFDNTVVMPAILKNADATAKLFGYPSYAHQSLVKKMAASVGVPGVRKFNEDLALLARPKAQTEFEVMRTFALEKLGIAEFLPWDFVYASEKMRQSLYALNEEEVRKYFPFTKAIEGIALLLQKIYGVTMTEKKGVSVWHPSVKFYELHDERGVLRGGFYADMYAREGKQPGAWMDVLLASRKLSDGVVIPIAYLNCNARMPEAGKDAYLTHSEVETLFHEFGHTEHHVLGLSEYQDQSMEHVEWDTVELPSQLFECWTWEPEMLRLMTEHEETKAPIPEDLIVRMLDAKFFNTGLFTLRQAMFGLFDWELYSEYNEKNPVDPNELWRKIVATMDVRPLDEVNRFPNSFKHIFAGGYSAGYFSYMWALGLAADTFLSFKEEGDIFSRRVGQRLLDEIIVPGSERPMAESFEIFRGRKLDPKALALHLGLLV
jgi:oligopeptidase A